MNLKTETKSATAAEMLTEKKEQETKNPQEFKSQWADVRLSSRIDPVKSLRPYIPEFQYHVVSVQSYTNKELLEKKDEYSGRDCSGSLQEDEPYRGINRQVCRKGKEGKTDGLFF